MSENKANVLNLGKSPTHTVLKLAWPTILEQLVMALLTIADAAMVGALGPGPSAAVGIVMPMTYLLNGLACAVSTGFSVVTAQSIGSNDMDRASRSANKGIFFAMISGLAVTAIFYLLAPHMPFLMGAEPEIAQMTTDYFRVFAFTAVLNISSTTCSAVLRSCGQTKTPLIINTCSIILNIILNFIFIFPSATLHFMGMELAFKGLDRGVKGAAEATVISMVLAFAVLFFTTYKNGRGIIISIKDMPKPDKDVYKNAAHVGLPIFFERITLGLGQVGYMRLVSTMGTSMIAAHHLAAQAESLSYLPCFGFSVAATTLVGQAVGARDYEKAEKFGHIACRAGMLYGFLAGLVLFFAGRPIMLIFTRDEELIHIGINLLRIVAVGQAIQAADFIYAGGIRGTGESRQPFYVALSGIWGIRILGTAITTFVFHMNIYAAWVMMDLDMFYRGTVSTICFLKRFRFLKEKKAAEDMN